MRKLLIAALLAVSTPALSAVWWNPTLGLWIGNICQTPAGWQAVAPLPVGATCYSPAWNSYGYIANY